MPETHQKDAVAALVAILNEDLPVCSWIVFSNGDGLEGWIVDQNDPAFDRLEAVHIWARKLGAFVTRTGKVLITFGSSGHVPIRILAKDVYR